VVDHGRVQVIGVHRPELVPVFSGLLVRQFTELVDVVRGRGAEQVGAGRRWGVPCQNSMQGL
jgi:hypothetical protein